MCRRDRDRIEAHGVSSYTVYNHMLLPASFKSLESDYHHLKEFVQVWDVAAERQVEITGKDSAKLVQLMTCRDLSKSKVGKCYYSPLVDQEGLLVNDPIINKLAEDRWWISIADSDVIFFAKGIASGNKFEVEIKEPNVNILAVQGPLAENLMAKLFGEEIRDLKFFNFKYFNINEHKYFIARSGWSKQGGFEVYVEDDIAGQDLYDYLFEFGKEFNIRPGCPNLIERIESALLSYGNDFDNRDNPFEANFDKFVNLDSDVNFLGKEKLKKIQQDGITRKLMGVKIDSNKIDMYCEKTLFDDKNNIVGYVRSATYSPTFKKVIGIAMINKPYWNSKDQFKIDIDERIFVGTVCDLPFI